MKVYIASDHSGFEIKEKLKKYLGELEQGYVLEDKGASEFNQDDDYPDFVHPLAQSVAAEAGSMGIVLGGSGEGEAISANRVRGARAIVFYGEAIPKQDIDIEGRKVNDPYEIVILGRLHNDANILSLSVRFLSFDEIKFACELFLSTKFENVERHARRIRKLG